MKNLLIILIIALVLTTIVVCTPCDEKIRHPNKKGKCVTWKDPLVSQKIIPNRHGVI